jgi:hypothetical protein
MRMVIELSIVVAMVSVVSVRFGFWRVNQNIKTWYSAQQNNLSI